jgi:hypothetical protein
MAKDSTSVTWIEAVDYTLDIRTDNLIFRFLVLGVGDKTAELNVAPTDPNVGLANDILSTLAALPWPSTDFEFQVDGHNELKGIRRKKVIAG